jgi:hypothetical protein
VGPARLALFVLAGPGIAQGLAVGEELAWVTLECPRASAYAGEELPLEVRFGLERGFLAEGLVPLFQRPLDLSVQIQAPWLAGGPGWSVRALEPAAECVSVALGDAVAKARRRGGEERGGRAFEVFSVELLLNARSPGELALEGPLLRFAAGTGFEEDLLRGRSARESREETRSGAALVVRVLALPEEGRPASFSGAVGRFLIAAEAEPRRVAVGGALELELSIEALLGDAEGFEAPLFPELADFHLRGHLEQREGRVRRLRYDLVLKNPNAREIPALAFGFFDPTPPGSYQEVQTAPIPLEVQPGEPEAPGGAPPAAPRGRPWESAALLAFAVLAGLAARAAVRRRQARHHRP